MVPGVEWYKINYSLKGATNVETELYKIVKASLSVYAKSKLARIQLWLMSEILLFMIVLTAPPFA